MKIKQVRCSGGVVFKQKGKVLVVNQRNVSWSLPKGHINEGEETLKAAQREIYEESGVKNLEFIKSLGSYKRYGMASEGSNNRSEMKKITMFLFKTDQEKLKPLDPHNPEAVWVDKEKVTDFLTHSADKKFFIKHLGEIA